MSVLTYDAMCYARDMHSKQTRKYTLDPYFIHVAEVAAITQTVTYSHSEVDPQIMIAVAWCHDLIEDCNVYKKTLADRFGKEVAEGVYLLSDIETGNRATRKQLAIERLSKAPAWVQSIKLADLISNTPSIVKHDPKFAVTYLQEASLYYDALALADKRLKIILASCFVYK